MDQDSEGKYSRTYSKPELVTGFRLLCCLYVMLWLLVVVHSTVLLFDKKPLNWLLNSYPILFKVKYLFQISFHIELYTNYLKLRMSVLFFIILSYDNWEFNNGDDQYISVIFVWWGMLRKGKI